MHIELCAMNLNCSNGLITNFWLICCPGFRGWWLSCAWLISVWPSTVLRVGIIKSTWKEPSPQETQPAPGCALVGSQGEVQKISRQSNLVIWLEEFEVAWISHLHGEDLFAAYNIRIREKWKLVYYRKTQKYRVRASVMQFFWVKG